MHRRDLLALLLPCALYAQDDCPRGFLPAYAHNDYENPRPLMGALALGYRGVEADVYLVDGVLRVGHDRRRARAGTSSPDRLVRVHNAPVDSTVYRRLLDAGVDLIGTEDIERSRALLIAIMKADPR